tara:strand:- start:722 stop:1051 length:330 start_codon:yes stop_codon:yes gene_type:complete
MNLIKFFIINFFIFLYSTSLIANTDQWIESEKTYYELVAEGYEVKAYDMNNIKIYEDQYILMFFVTVLQKKNSVYECQEYQTLDTNMQTIELNISCKELVKPFERGLGT